jgi:hypothetical protein
MNFNRIFGAKPSRKSTLSDDALATTSRASSSGPKPAKQQCNSCYFEDTRTSELERLPRPAISIVSHNCSGPNTLKRFVLTSFQLINFIFSLQTLSLENFAGADDLADAIMARGAGIFNINDSFTPNQMKNYVICQNHQKELGTNWSAKGRGYKHFEYSGSKKYCGISNNVFSEIGCNASLTGAKTLSKGLSKRLLYNKNVLYQFGTRKFAYPN